jgi:hypothetical protein
MVLEGLPEWKVAYGHIEELAGVICPLLSVVSLLHYAGVLNWSALLFLWLGCGHTVLYFYDLYPPLRYRPFFRGMFAFGVGLCWPLWYATHIDRPRRA